MTNNADVKNIFVFDMDGTLTPARLPMTDDFARRFMPFLENHPCFVATGSDTVKVAEQVPEKVRRAFTGLYCSMGNELWAKGKMVYRKDFELEPEFLRRLEDYRKNTRYPYALYGNYLEKRVGMVNFSVLGRDCPYDERERYNAWDAQAGERQKIRQEMSAAFPQYELTLGGNISLDIVRHGFGKEQIADDLRARYPAAHICFFGDRTFKGGNDFALANRLNAMENTQVVQIENPDGVLDFLKI